MFFGLDRTGQWSAVPRLSAPQSLPRVHPGLYGGSCVRGSSKSSYRRIRRARWARSLSGLGPFPAWRHWNRPGRWKWLTSLHRLATGEQGLAQAIRTLQEALPASLLAHWSLSLGLTALILYVGETSRLFHPGTSQTGVVPEITQVAIPAIPGSTALPDISRGEPAAPRAPEAVAVPEVPVVVAAPVHEPAPVAAPLPEPQPGVQDAVAQSFPVLAMQHYGRSLASRDLLRERHAVYLAVAQAQAANREAEEHAIVCQALQRQRVVAQALTVGRLRVDGAKEATLSLEIYDSFESLERGRPDGGPDAELFTVNLAGHRFEATDRYSEFVSSGGPVEITNYGYAADFTGDHNSNRLATGLGGCRPLIPGISAALSRALSAKLRAQPGAVIEFMDGRGKSFLVTYDDQSPQGNLNIDVYRPTFGSNNFRGHVRAAKLVRQGDFRVSHGQDGLPYSLKNYRAALLQLAAENPFPGYSEATGQTAPSLPQPAPRAGGANDFEAVEDPLPLARQLDQFANTPFASTGFATSQEITGYLQAGAQSLAHGTQLARKWGLRPAEFPPILRMRANLEAAFEAQQAICGREALLKKEYQECESEMFRIKVRACIEDNPLQLLEVRNQIGDLECTQAAILAQLEDQQGRICPPSPQEASPEIRIALDSLETTPDS